MADEDEPTPVQDVLKNQTTRQALERHVSERIQHQQIVNQSKPGQVPAEEVVGLVGDNAFLPDGPEARTKSLMGLVELTRYDDVSGEDVTRLAQSGTDLSDPQMWNLVVGNARLMEANIKQGLTVNKILPDETIDNVLTHKQTWVKKTGNVVDKDSSGNVIGGTMLGGSVADERYYERLTGEQAIANFGLDYGGYSAGTVKHDLSDGSGGNHSSYVVDASPDSEGRTLTSVPNVFYVKVKVPDTSLDQIKVPVHGNVSKWANDKLVEVNKAIGDPSIVKDLAAKAGVKEKEMLEKLQERQKTLKTFVDNSKVDVGMTTTLKPDGLGGHVKNQEDPLTNMGMTKPSSRLQTDFETINQEYHIKTMFPVSEGSKLYLKGSDGVDVEVGEMVKNQNTGKLEFGNLKTDVINKKLKENQSVRESPVLQSGLNHVEQPKEKTNFQVQESTDIMKQKLNLNRVEEVEKPTLEPVVEDFQKVQLKSPSQVQVEKPKAELAEWQTKKLRSVRESTGLSSSEKPNLGGHGKKQGI